MFSSARSHDEAADHDAIARLYAACRDVSPAVVDHLAERLTSPAISSILEMGCGTADYLAALLAKTNACGFGFDKSSKMLEQGRRKHPGAALVRADAEGRFPFQAGSFDACFSVNLIHYVTDLPAFFAEVYRVARPEAVVVTVTDSEEDIHRRTISEYFPQSVPLELDRYPAISEVRRAMEAAGWTGAHVTHTERTFPLDRPVLERFERKAYSALRLIPQSAFEAGIARLKNDLATGGAMVRELYTYVWGRK